MHDGWICQICATIKPDTERPEWRPEITGHKSAGNVCALCRSLHRGTKLVGEELRHYVTRRNQLVKLLPEPDQPMSLHEHCRQESGLTGDELERYITRYYS
jgi:hypothetical protein